MAINWFILTCGVLQLVGAVHWLATGSIKLGWLYVLYAMTNFILATME